MPEPVSEDQIRVIYRETIDALYSSISRRCNGDRDLAEDVVQETWLRAVRDWQPKGIPRSPIAWLSTVSRNLLLNELRRRQAVPIESLAPGEASEPVVSDVDGASEDAKTTVNHAISQLPSEQARLLKAFYIERHRMSSIAERLGISERAVEGRLRRAREKLRAALGIAIK
jgi:RNA polymerase sigma-70 factor (ECF subfamily)